MFCDCDKNNEYSARYPSVFDKYNQTYSVFQLQARRTSTVHSKPKMELNLKSLEAFTQLKELCRRLIQNNKDKDALIELVQLLEDAPESLSPLILQTVLPTLYPILRSISENRDSFSENEKLVIVNILNICFKKIIIDKEGIFFNFYGFLLFECYNQKTHKVRNISEEYKLIIMQCMKSLSNSISSELIPRVYTKLNAPKLCQIIFIAIEMAKYERMQALRIAAMECVMAMARVLEDTDFQDVVMRYQISELFMFFLPGVSKGLQKIILVDEKIGHKVPLVALKAWGRLTTMMMQDYNPADSKLTLEDVKISEPSTPMSCAPKAKFTTKESVEDFLKNTVRSPEWYRENDQNLEELVKEFRKLTTHSHPKLRFELVETSELIVENCLTTMPRSIRHFIEINIILTEDTEENIRTKSMQLLQKISDKLSSPELRIIFEYLEDGFHQCIHSLPRIFNGLDEGGKLASINLLIGYLILFGEYKLTHVLLSVNHLNTMIQALMHISELEKSKTVFRITPLGGAIFDMTEKYTWKQFVHFRDDRVEMKLEKLCSLLANEESFRMVADALLDIIQYEVENKKEAVFILNATLSGCQVSDDNFDILKVILLTYIEPQHFDVPLEVGSDDSGTYHTLDEVHHNIIQVSILLDGIGDIASVLGTRFQNFLQKVLYLVFEKTGNRHPYVSSAGALALEKIAKSCGHETIAELIKANIDYISFYVKHRLKAVEEKKKVLEVITVVLKYTSLEVLPYISHLIHDALESIDENITHATVFLEVFNVFIVTLRRWLGIEKKIEPIKSREERYKEMQEFTVSGIEEVNFSDDTVMGMSPEEMFRQDMQKKQEELMREIEEPEVEEYKKEDPPLHVVLATEVLQRSLHFLPSRNKERRLKALEILVNGIEILGDWEDELLPIVHQIWPPLVQRFKEFSDPLIINYSFQLLIILARLSNEFIRMRTTKEALPYIMELMKKLSADSYMKDRGSAYRYTQAYKLQLCVLEGIGRVMVDLDILEEKIGEVVEMLMLYLSNKQPVPLQERAVKSIKALMIYDLSTVILKLKVWQRNSEFQKNVDLLLNCSEPSKLEDQTDAVQ